MHSGSTGRKESGTKALHAPHGTATTSERLFMAASTSLATLGERKSVQVTSHLWLVQKCRWLSTLCAAPNPKAGAARTVDAQFSEWCCGRDHLQERPPLLPACMVTGARAHACMHHQLASMAGGMNGEG